MRILMTSWTCALLEFNLFIRLLMLLAVNCNGESDLWVIGVKTEGIVLLFCINEDYLEKWSLKSLLFSWKLNMKLLL